MKQPDRSLAAALEAFMKPRAFEFITRREAFFRTRPDGFDYFSWATHPLDTGPTWRAGYHEGHYGLGLRHDAIEAIYEALDLTYGEENKRWGPTVYRAAGGYFPFDPSRDHELCLRFDHLDADIASAARRIEVMLEKDGLEWYARYADIVTLARDLNDPITTRGAHPLLNNGERRPLVGVAAACVAEPDKVASLTKAYLDVAMAEDEQLADRRAPQAPVLAQRFSILLNRAKELGYPV